MVSKEELAKLASQVIGILAAIIILAIVQAVAVRLPVMGIAVYRHISGRHCFRRFFRCNNHPCSLIRQGDCPMGGGSVSHFPGGGYVHQ